ncbi:ABC transporter ATP-binding protein [Microbacterium pumilum]|uniref:ABC transporter domain-containing protein n=1 Tax=Microbacterium pumilum TaxID=344165 RepID=A0ABN2S398_9MICO
MIEVRNLTKRYKDVTAVDDLTFTVRPGIVTGFVGPNGAGKSTTMRAIAGLDVPTSGAVRVNGKALVDTKSAMSELGVVLDAGLAHPGRSARNHLRALAATNGIPEARIDEVARLTGISDVAHRRAGTFSLGMAQRLGIAAALLGDPLTLVLDEPINGLDPDGIIWLRGLMRSLADEGRTVFVSSHLMGELGLIADRIIVIGKGRLLADGPVEAILKSSSSESLEAAYISLTGGSTQYRSGAPATQPSLEKGK